jgi:hypothetical protein
VLSTAASSLVSALCCLLSAAALPPYVLWSLFSVLCCLVVWCLVSAVHYPLPLFYYMIVLSFRFSGFAAATDSICDRCSPPLCCLLSAVSRGPRGDAGVCFVLSSTVFLWLRTLGSTFSLHTYHPPSTPPTPAHSTYPSKSPISFFFCGGDL